MEMKELGLSPTPQNGTVCPVTGPSLSASREKAAALPVLVLVGFLSQEHATIWASPLYDRDPMRPPRKDDRPSRVRRPAPQCRQKGAVPRYYQ